MTTAIFSFALGIFCLQLLPELPAWWLIQCCLLLSLLAACVCYSYKFTGRGCVLLLVMLGLGFAWAAIAGQRRLADELPSDSELRDCVLIGTVSSLPQKTASGWRLAFSVESSSLPVPSKVLLSWYGRADDGAEEAVLTSGRVPSIHVPKAGERWRLTVRLKRPHGNVNPYGFDYEGWLFEQGIRATGYVRPNAEQQRLSAFVWSAGNAVEGLREQIRYRFQTMLGDRPYGGILVALAVGDQAAIPAEQWTLFARTGLTHLLSVSGLHITMVAGLAYALANWLWRRSSRLCLVMPAQQFAALIGMVFALAYALLAGWAIPAQRTVMMLAVIGVSLFWRRTLAIHRVLSAAVFVVLLLDPWAVMSAGFWLSFGAVALLVYSGSGRLGGSAGWRVGIASWGRAQWAMTVGMLPLMLALFQQFSLVSPLANAIAIPLVSFVITPLALLAMLPGLAFLLLPAHWLAEWMMRGVTYLSAIPWSVWQQAEPPVWALLAGVVGGIWLLAPRGFPARYIGVFLLLPLFFCPHERPAVGQMKVVVLDVGQGLAVHVQTAQHDLLFDTGPKFSITADSGNRVIAPYFRALGISHLDALIVSHKDSDHAGGAQSVLAALPSRRFISSMEQSNGILQLPENAERCQAGSSWTWDGVRFSILHPTAQWYQLPQQKTNNLSCVLRVDSQYGSVLLPGDVERVAEQALLSSAATPLAADILIAPHHGSHTSSSPAFIAAISPRFGVFTVGYRNRFGHPKADVVARYAVHGARILRSDSDGAITFLIGENGIQFIRERERQQRYWMN